MWRTTVFFMLFCMAAAKSFECGKPAVKSARHGPIGRKFNRIVGGYEATPHSLPWQVRVLRNKYGNMYSLCGGSLIQLKSGNSTDLVLTAAHCLEERGVYATADKVKVILGAHNVKDPDEPSQVTVFVKAFSHGSFNEKTKENDIALLRLEKRVLHTNVTIPVCLPMTNEKLPVGKTCYVSGWGVQHEGASSSPSKLHEVDAEILDQKNCKSVTNDENMFCAGTLLGGKDSCQGDSGGPLVCEIDGKFTQYGVVSFGAGCGKMNYAGVYTLVSRFVDWLKKEEAKLPASSGYVEPYKNPDSEGLPKPAGFSFPSGLELPSGFQLPSTFQLPNGLQSAGTAYSPTAPQTPSSRPARPKPSVSSGSSPSFDSIFQSSGLGGTGELGSTGGISGLGGFGGHDDFGNFGGFGGIGSLSSLGAKFPEFGSLMDGFSKKPGKPGSKVTGSYTLTTYDGKGKPITQTYKY